MRSFWYVFSSFDHEIKYFQRKTLQLLSELAVGYATVRKLVKLDSVKQLLHNHQEFPFLQINQDAFDSKKTVKRLKVSVKLTPSVQRFLIEGQMKKIF